MSNKTTKVGKKIMLAGIIMMLVPFAIALGILFGLIVYGLIVG